VFSFDVLQQHKHRSSDDHNHMRKVVKVLTLAAPLPNFSTVSKSAALDIPSSSDSSSSLSRGINTASVDDDASLVSSAKRGEKFGFDKGYNKDLRGVGGLKKASEVCTTSAVRTKASTTNVDVVVVVVPVADIMVIQERV
jgi:hypothetical protein